MDNKNKKRCYTMNEDEWWRIFNLVVVRFVCTKQQIGSNEKWDTTKKERRCAWAKKKGDSTWRNIVLLMLIFIFRYFLLTLFFVFHFDLHEKWSKNSIIKTIRFPSDKKLSFERCARFVSPSLLFTLRFWENRKQEKEKIEIRRLFPIQRCTSTIM